MSPYIFLLFKKNALDKANIDILVAKILIRTKELHLWSLESLELVNRFESHKQEKFIITCCFGGGSDHLLTCGGEGFS